MSKLHFLVDLFRGLWGSTAAVVIIPKRLRRPVPLKEHDPYWLPDPHRAGGRYGIGLGLHCPAHGDHRVLLYFTNPLDGGVQQPNMKLYTVENVVEEDNEATWDVLTLTAPDQALPIHHFCGASFFIVGGAVILSGR